ncbi:hypothetical protein NEOLEDRAFT_1149069 [Neolentinus lepideus HHB14362 ss-1]|uniref:Uncharacterized protein n=1 Tax=Neolentinus lepideus HHB14362 ss-1 TaxID=1314782 RepID=A0A165RGE5_9AGAM|nr:hypothetical protein NEOLEDRAFT_1149069 [Neolentinus lepideus HHB14362 ss-1]
MSTKPSTMQPAFTLILNNRDYTPSPRPYFSEVWYPPSPEPFSKYDPLMKTVDLRRIDSCSFASDLCAPAMSDIVEEEEGHGVIIFSEEVNESARVRKRPKILLLLEKAACPRERAVVATTNAEC